ncbi:hypothetical protein HK102_003476, partial [Quaeritorhiza haematococci]
MRSNTDDDYLQNGFPSPRIFADIMREKQQRKAQQPPSSSSTSNEPPRHTDSAQPDDEEEGEIIEGIPSPHVKDQPSTSATSSKPETPQASSRPSSRLSPQPASQPSEEQQQTQPRRKGKQKSKWESESEDDTHPPPPSASKPKKPLSTTVSSTVTSKNATPHHRTHRSESGTPDSRKRGLSDVVMENISPESTNTAGRVGMEEEETTVKRRRFEELGGSAGVGTPDNGMGGEGGYTSRLMSVSPPYFPEPYDATGTPMTLDSADDVAITPTAATIGGADTTTGGASDTDENNASSPSRLLSSDGRIPPWPRTNALVGPLLTGCRSVNNYEKLNRIDEGAYGVVYRARDRTTGEIVALKKLKLEREKNGFPVTSLREIFTLLLAKHPHIVDVKEILVTPNLNSIFIAMEFVEHDLKSLMESSMSSPFLQSEIKTLMIQLLSAVGCLHSNWIVHRDLKTSNLLMNNKGEIKVADFGLARRYGSPLGHMTQLVVTLWYRAPELLLGAKEYTTAVDMWSVGCIFGELVNKEPLLPGRSEIDQLNKIFQLLGTPTDRIWPGFSDLPNARTVNFANQPYNRLRSRFAYLTENGLDLLSKLLTYDPDKRITAEEALRHPYFTESPLPKDPSLFPTFPSKGAGEKRKT